MRAYVYLCLCEAIYISSIFSVAGMDGTAEAGGGTT